MKRSRLVGVITVLLISGCAGVGPAITIAGMVVSTIIQEQIDQKEHEELSRELETKSPPTGAEAIGPAQDGLVRVWVDETVQDGRLTTAHFDTRSLQPVH